MVNLTEIIGIKFFKSPNSKKKYRALFKDGSTVDFGASGYQQYQDRIPKRQGGKLYSRLDHNDKARRDRYKARHGKIKLKDGSLAINKKYSAAWFSWNFLW